LRLRKARPQQCVQALSDCGDHGSGVKGAEGREDLDQVAGEQYSDHLRDIAAKPSSSPRS
jgi:hypothetical protein